jgi:hypothetical protein
LQYHECMAAAAGEWRLFTNHMTVLLCIARDPDSRLRDIAAVADLTEHAVNRIVNQLCEWGLITRMRHGRRNSYSLHPEATIPHPLGEEHRLGDLLAAVMDGWQPRRSARRRTAADGRVAAGPAAGATR